MAFESLDEAIEWAVADPTRFADAASLKKIYRFSAQLDGVAAIASAAFDDSEEWALDGAQNSTQWIATAIHVPKGVARKRLALGHKVKDMPGFEEALLAGEITEDHVAAMGRHVNAETKEAFERDEEMLVGEAKRLRFDWFKRAADYWGSLADPDGTEEAAEARKTRRDVWLTQSFNGTWLGKMNLDDVSGVIVSNELTRLEQQLFDADWAEARERLGRDPGPGDLRRTPAQRRADALVEMAIRSASTPKDAQRPAPLFSVFVGYETLKGRICQLAQGAVVSPGSLVPYLDDALIERAVFTPTNRVDVSVTARLFTGATRRAIELRDRECQHPYCDRPADQCQADHIVPWSEGGLTTQENGRLLCGFHNRLRNHRPDDGPPCDGHPPDQGAPPDDGL